MAPGVTVSVAGGVAVVGEQLPGPVPAATAPELLDPPPEPLDEDPPLDPPPELELLEPFPEVFTPELLLDAFAPDPLPGHFRSCCSRFRCPSCCSRFRLFRPELLFPFPELLFPFPELLFPLPELPLPPFPFPLPELLFPLLDPLPLLPFPEEELSPPIIEARVRRRTRAGAYRARTAQEGRDQTQRCGRAFCKHQRVLLVNVDAVKKFIVPGTSRPAGPNRRPAASMDAHISIGGSSKCRRRRSLGPQSARSSAGEPAGAPGVDNPHLWQLCSIRRTSTSDRWRP